MDRKKSPLAIAMSGHAPIMDIDHIAAHVAFIKINKLFSRCVNALGVVNSAQIKEVTRGIWVINDVAKRNTVQYLFALYKGRVFGVYHVLSVSSDIASAYRNGLPDFPTYPDDVRECDRWKARFEMTSAAKQTLSMVEYQRFVESLKRPKVTADHVLALDRQRIYFSVDDVIPDDLKKFVGCQIKRTSGFGGEILSDRFHPVIFNF